jgi:hypothetical protein
MRLALAVPLIALAGAAVSTPTGQNKSVPAATIQELMRNQVDPAADLLWASVSTVITAAGTQEKQPRTAEEWLAVRRLAVTLVDAGTSLLAAPRRVVQAGATTDDAEVPGIESPQNMQCAIDADPAAFRRAAAAFRNAGLKALAAIDRRDADALTVAGGDLDAACEACHLTYWYPRSPRPQ